MPRLSATARRTARVAVAAAIPLLLCSCDLGVLDPKGPVGVSERLILIDSLGIMLLIVVPVLCATVGFAWWFRESNGRAFYLPEWEFNGTLELVVWSIPLLVIIVLGGVAYFGSHALDPYKPLPAADGGKPLEVQVVSMDWKWLFIYPELGVASLQSSWYMPDRSGLSPFTPDLGLGCNELLLRAAQLGSHDLYDGRA